MALPCLGKLRLGALKVEAPTGALCQAARSGYDSEGRGGQLLCELDDYLRRQLEGVDRNVIYAREEMDHFERPEIRDRFMELRHEAERNLRDALAAADEVRLRVLPEVATMREVIEGAIRDGVFAEPLARQIEDARIAEERVRRLLAERVAALPPPAYSPSSPSYSPTAPPPPSYSRPTPAFVPPSNSPTAPPPTYAPAYSPTTPEHSSPTPERGALPALAVPFMIRVIRDAIREGYQYSDVEHGVPSLSLLREDAAAGVLETRPEYYIANRYEGALAWRANRLRAAPLDPRARDLPSVERIEQIYRTEPEAKDFMVRAINDAVMFHGYRYANVVPDMDGALPERTMEYVANLYEDVRQWRANGQPTAYSTHSPTRSSPWSPIPEQAPRSSPSYTPTAPFYTPTVPSYTAGGSPRAATDDVPAYHDPYQEDIVVRAQRQARERREADAAARRREAARRLQAAWDAESSEEERPGPRAIDSSDDSSDDGGRDNLPLAQRRPR